MIGQLTHKAIEFVDFGDKAPPRKVARVNEHVPGRDFVSHSSDGVVRVGDAHEAHGVRPYRRIQSQRRQHAFIVLVRLELSPSGVGILCQWMNCDRCAGGTHHGMLDGTGDCLVSFSPLPDDRGHAHRQSVCVGTCYESMALKIGLIISDISRSIRNLILSRAR
ncbi:unnamed protein product [Ixodes pacificus]